MAGRRCPACDGHEPYVPALDAAERAVAVEFDLHCHYFVVGPHLSAVRRSVGLLVRVPVLVVIHQRPELHFLFVAVRNSRPRDRSDDGEGEGGSADRSQKPPHQAGAGWLAVSETRSALTMRRWRAEPFG